MLLDRHRVARLVELAALERSLKGPERMIREEDVSLLIKAAYDDASDEARAAFMAKVSTLPTSAWPWSAVQAAPAMSARGGSVPKVVAYPVPVVPSPPPLLILIRGQADSADADPGNRLPARGTLEAAEWEPLHAALDRWDSGALLKWIGPQGWVTPAGATAGASSSGADSSDGEDSSKPAETPTSLPAPQDVPPSVPLWRQPAVLAAGAAAVLATGVTVYVLTRPGDRELLEAELRRQQEGR